MRHKKLLWIAPLAVLAFAVFGFVVMLLWNWLMPALFALPRIGYWQAWGLLLLCKLLFGGFHPHVTSSRRWRERVIEHWESLTPEEQERIRQKMRARCGGFTRPPAEPPAGSPTQA
ncbi:MAG TPA: hypothetical protein VMU19_09850 [Bryobacteraceae bacterium]|nr:hypothetical protein [Bryobacteraceae bacterium]